MSKKYYLMAVIIIVFNLIAATLGFGYLYRAHHYIQAADKELSILRPLAVQLERLDTLGIDEKHHEANLLEPNYLQEANPKTIDELNKLIFTHYQSVKSQLSHQWNIKDEEVLITAYIMNTVHNLWAFGNSEFVKLRGCVYTNEKGYFVHPNAPISSSLSLYLNSKIGCCTDYAKMMKILLTRAGVKNRYTQNSGHVFNEVLIHGRWRAVDATVNFMWDEDWASIQFSEPMHGIKVMIFDTPETQVGHKRYRPFIGQFRTFMLLEAVYKLAKDIEHPKTIFIDTRMNYNQKAL